MPKSSRKLNSRGQRFTFEPEITAKAARAQWRVMRCRSDTRAELTRKEKKLDGAMPKAFLRLSFTTLQAAKRSLPMARSLLLTDQAGVYATLNSKVKETSDQDTGALARICYLWSGGPAIANRLVHSSWVSLLCANFLRLSVLPG